MINDITRPECRDCKFADKKALSRNKPYCTYPGFITVKDGVCERKRVKL